MRLLRRAAPAPGAAHDQEESLAALRPILARYAKERAPGERFGDFVVRAGYVRAVESGRDFHADEDKLRM